MFVVGFGNVLYVWFEGLGVWVMYGFFLEGVWLMFFVFLLIDGGKSILVIGCFDGLLVLKLIVDLLFCFEVG